MPTVLADVITVEDDGRVVHAYYSTHCRHAAVAAMAGDLDESARFHGACAADRMAGDTPEHGRAMPRRVEIGRRPAQCKTCSSPCACPCHAGDNS